MAAYYVKTLSDNLGYVTWIYYPAMGTLNCNPMFNNVLSIISVYGIRDCCNQIKYDYGRLVGISYLDHSENDMKYHYGATYDSWNRVRTNDLSRRRSGYLSLQCGGAGGKSYEQQTRQKRNPYRKDRLR